MGKRFWLVGLFVFVGMVVTTGLMFGVLVHETTHMVLNTPNHVNGLCIGVCPDTAVLFESLAGEANCDITLAYAFGGITYIDEGGNKDELAPTAFGAAATLVWIALFLYFFSALYKRLDLLELGE